MDPVKPNNQTLLSDFMKRLFSTDEVQQATKTVSSELLQNWAEKSWIKKQVVKRIENSLNNRLQSKDQHLPAELISFLEEHELIPVLLENFPLGINGMIDISLSVMQSLEKLPAQEKIERVGNAIDKSALFRSGQLITGIAKFINDIHNESPTFFSEKIAPHFDQWLEQTDFGELRETLEKSEEDIVALMSAINTSLSESPAKMVCLYSCLPLLINISAAGMKSSLVTHNNMAPEILADILCSLLKDIDVKTIALLLNETNEISRKIFTGGALLSDSGGSALSDILAEKVAAISSELDLNLMYKASDMLATTKEHYESALIDKSKHHPEQAAAYFRRLIKPLIDAPHTWNRKITAIEDLLTDDQIADELARGVEDIDIPELAETVNRFLTMVNTVSPLMSEKGINPMAQFISSLDLYELSETVKMLTDDTVKSLKPVANEVMPHLIRGVTELLKPDSSEHNTELDAALAEFRSVIFREEVK